MKKNFKELEISINLYLQAPKAPSDLFLYRKKLEHYIFGLFAISKCQRDCFACLVGAVIAFVKPQRTKC